jgi:hypothetical protein
LILDTLRIRGLDIQFTIEKSARHEPNKAQIKVWNLTRDHRRQIQSLSRSRGAGRIRAQLEAGYEGMTGILFSGNLRTADSAPEGPDYITSVEGEDGGHAYQTTRVNESFPPGTSIATPVRACARALGVGLGNLEDAIASATLEGGGTTFPSGTAISGRAADELTELLRSCGLRWSVQNGVLQILRRNEALQSTAVRLTPTSGLIGIPSVDADGKVKARALLNSDIYPGRTVQFETIDLSGTYRVEKAKYIGDSFGQDWYVDVECEELSVRT